MKTFTTSPTCPKCTSNSVGIKYTGKTTSAEGKVLPERIRCTCNKCGYPWNMECAKEGK